MATQRIEIVVTSTGAPVVQRNINNIADAADRADARLRLMQRALAILGGGAILNGLKNYADTFTNIQNKLRFVIEDTGQLAGVTNALFDISMKTRSSFEATATLYSRVSLATQNLAVSQQQLLDFTQSLNQATILSGATSIEAYNAIRQLSQGMAKGRLDGDELRSVLEQLPVVADIIAKQMGVTRGALKDLGSQGKITPAIILEGFKTAKEWLDGNFSKTIPTISQSMTQLETATIRIVSEIDRTTGASQFFARVIFTLANNLDIAAISIIAAGGALLTYFAPAIITGIAGAVAALWGVLLANPFIALAAVIVGAGIALLSFNDSMDETMKQMGVTVNFLNKMAANWAGVKEYIKTAWSDLPNFFEYLWVTVINGMVTMIEKAVNAIGAFLAWLVNKVPGINLTPNEIDLSSWKMKMSDGAYNVGDAAAEAFNNAFRKTILELAVPIGVVNDRTNNKIVPPTGEATKGPTFESIREDLWDQQFLLQQEYDTRKKLTEIYAIEKQLKRALTEPERAQIDRILTLNAQLEIQANLWDEIVQPAIVYGKTQSALNELMKQGKIEVDQYNKKWIELRLSYLETQTTIEAGIERSLLRMHTEFNDMSKLLEDAFTGAFKGMEDALVDMVMTGKVQFGDLAKSIIADLIRIAIRASIVQPLINSITGGGGQGGTNWAGLIGQAIGSFMGFGGGMNIAAGIQASGAVTTPVYSGSVTGVPLATGTNRVPYDGFLASLHKDEAVVPAKYNPAAGGSGGGVVVIQPIIYNNASDKVSARVETETDDQGNTSMRVMIDNVERELAARVDSGKSPLLTSMSRATGTTPKPRGR